jgi:hypothetical protein
MTQEQVQALQIAIAAVGYLVVVLRLARKGAISFRYSMGWLGLFSILLLVTAAIPVMRPVASFLRVAPFTVVGGGAALVLVGICLQLSISISGLQRQIHRLNEEIAFLKASRADV